MNESVDPFKGYGVAVNLNSHGDFLKVAETLTRIGVANAKDKILNQSCYIICRSDKYAILHFKELFGFIGRESNFDKNDALRRDYIALCLENWGMLSCVEKIDPNIKCGTTKFLRHSEKGDWVLKSRFNLNNLKSVR